MITITKTQEGTLLVKKGSKSFIYQGKSKKGARKKAERVFS